MNVDMRIIPRHDDQFPLVSINYDYLVGDATPMFVAKDRRTGIHAVEKLAEWVDAFGSTQVTIRSDGEPVVMQGAAATRGNICAGCSRWKWFGRESS